MITWHELSQEPYEAHFNPNLPWGYWLLATGETDGWPPLVDYEGRKWNSVREYFWTARLGMARIASTDRRNEELEFLLAVLVALDRRVIGIEEKAIDLLKDWDRSRHYLIWLQGRMLLKPNPEADLDSSLSPEGQAVLLMLASTRSADAVPFPIGLPTVKSVHGLTGHAHEEERERIIAKQEQAARHLQYRFARQEIRDEPGITLAGVGLGPNVPLTRVLWSTLFPDVYARDRMLFWLHERIDRWPDWGELAYRQGARALTELLMHLAFADKVIGQD